MGVLGVFSQGKGRNEMRGEEERGERKEGKGRLPG